jgi:hypothetical protein
MKRACRGPAGPTGPAGGDLAGSYPNPTIANEANGLIGSLGGLSDGHGITQDQITHPSTGVYCFDTTPNPSGMFGSPLPGSVGKIFTVHPASGSCPNFESVVEFYTTAAAPVDASFYILLKRARLGTYALTHMQVVVAHVSCVPGLTLGFLDHRSGA